jgi:hypothetical protein
MFNRLCVQLMIIVALFSASFAVKLSDSSSEFYTSADGKKLLAEKLLGVIPVETKSNDCAGNVSVLRKYWFWLPPGLQSQILNEAVSQLRGPLFFPRIPQNTLVTLVKNFVDDSVNEQEACDCAWRMISTELRRREEAVDFKLFHHTMNDGGRGLILHFKRGTTINTLMYSLPGCGSERRHGVPRYVGIKIEPLDMDGDCAISALGVSTGYRFSLRNGFLNYTVTTYPDPRGQLYNSFWLTFALSKPVEQDIYMMLSIMTDHVGFTLFAKT